MHLPTIFIHLFPIWLMSCTNGFSVKHHVIDLTHELNENTIYWPGNPIFNFTILSRGQSENFWYETNFIAQAEHGGTHLDAPAHFYKGSWRTQQIPLDKLHGPGVIIDVKTKVKLNPNYRVTKKDVMAWEEKHGEIPKNAVIIMNSGWGEHYPNKTHIFGTPEFDDPNNFQFPGWHEETVNWLIKNRNFNLLGVDTPSIDYGKSQTFPVHVLVSKENIPGLENVANLDKIPESGSEIFAPVIKTLDGSGGPARIFAVKFESDGNGISSAVSLSSTWVLVALINLVFYYM